MKERSYMKLLVYVYFYVVLKEKEFVCDFFIFAGLFTRKLHLPD